MKKILIILTTILLSISIAGCGNFTERYDSDISKIINDINTNEFKDKKEITRNDIDIQIFNIYYNSELLSGRHLTYQINYKDSSNNSTLSLLFFKKNSNISRLTYDYKYNDAEKVELYKEKNIKNDDAKSSNFYMILTFILFIFLSYLRLSTSKPTNGKSNKIGEPSKIITNTNNNNLCSKSIIQVTNKRTVTIENWNKLFLIYSNIIISFLATLYTIKKYSTFNSRTPLPFAPSRGIEDNADLLFYIIIFIFILAVAGLFLLLTCIIKNKIIAILLVPTASALAYYIFSKYDIRMLTAVTFLFFLIINYIIIKSLPKLYLLLHENSGTEEALTAKLTLLWTILAFILGIIFNVKN